MADCINPAGPVLNALLLPLAGCQLLVPQLVVAELVDFQSPRPLAGMPDGVLGEIRWREQPVPLLSFEVACGAPACYPARARIAVLNALAGQPGRPFIALLLQGIPRALRVSGRLPAAPRPPGLLEQAVALVDGQPVAIPDLRALERLLEEGGPAQASA